LKNSASNKGFTLVEVMVALAVVAVALPALLMSLYQQVDGTAYLRDRSLASMVAANKLVELRLLSRARQSLLKGRDSGIEEFGEREWYWWIESTPTEIEQFYRLEIRVAAGEDDEQQPLHTLVAFLSDDLRVEVEVPDVGG
jgi:general secretion pathway protein I